MTQLHIEVAQISIIYNSEFSLIQYRFRRLSLRIIFGVGKRKIGICMFWGKVVQWISSQLEEWRSIFKPPHWQGDAESTGIKRAKPHLILSAPNFFTPLSPHGVTLNRYMQTLCNPLLEESCVLWIAVNNPRMKHIPTERGDGHRGGWRKRILSQRGRRERTSIKEWSGICGVFVMRLAFERFESLFKFSLCEFRVLSAWSTLKIFLPNYNSSLLPADSWQSLSHTYFLLNSCMVRD